MYHSPEKIVGTNVSAEPDAPEGLENTPEGDVLEISTPEDIEHFLESVKEETAERYKEAGMSQAEFEQTNVHQHLEDFADLLKDLSVAMETGDENNMPDAALIQTAYEQVVQADFEQQESDETASDDQISEEGIGVDLSKAPKSVTLSPDNLDEDEGKVLVRLNPSIILETDLIEEDPESPEDEGFSVVQETIPDSFTPASVTAKLEKTVVSVEDEHERLRGDLKKQADLIEDKSLGVVDRFFGDGDSMYEKLADIPYEEVMSWDSLNMQGLMQQLEPANLTHDMYKQWSSLASEIEVIAGSTTDQTFKEVVDMYLETKL